ncbi:MAG: GDP-mannose 4,6-dehydratase [candidate division WOR-3 bacterium]|nr:GDP-mannose 4,6-dehydratase [candidate division WOR-3 bacterium]
MKKVLITGIEGFVGNYLAGYLQSLGYDIYGTYWAIPQKTNYKIYYCDIRNYSEILRVIKTIRPQIIFHLAAQSSVSQAEKNLKDTFAINTMGTLNVLESIRETKIRPRVIYISSCEVYGRSARKLTERMPPNPVSFYALSKLCAEKICLYYVSQYNLDIVILRPFSHTAPGQAEHFIFPSIAKRIAEIEVGKRKPVLQVGNINVKRDYLDVSDVIRAYYLAMKKGKTGEIYNITSGKPYTIKECIAFLLKLSKKKIKITTIKSLIRANDIPILTGSAQKFSQLTGWKPEVSFYTTLADLLNYYRMQMETGIS